MDISHHLCVKQPQIRYNVRHVHQKQKVLDSVCFCATKGSKKYEMGRSELQCEHSRLGKLEARVALDVRVPAFIMNLVPSLCGGYLRCKSCEGTCQDHIEEDLRMRESGQEK